MVNVTETSMFLRWNKPDGNADSYLIRDQDNKNISSETNFKEIEGLKSGRAYAFSVFSKVPSHLSAASNVAAFTSQFMKLNIFLCVYEAQVMFVRVDEVLQRFLCGVDQFSSV